MVIISTTCEVDKAIRSWDNRVSWYHRLYASASLVFNGDWAYQWETANADHLQNRHPLTDRQKFVTGDYVGDPYMYVKFGANPSTAGFCENGLNVIKTILYHYCLRL